MFVNLAVFERDQLAQAEPQEQSSVRSRADKSFALSYYISHEAPKGTHAAQTV
jgi:hypothetical protein